MFDLKVVVEEIKGFCDLPMQPGDYFEVRGGKILIPPGKHICLWALQSLLPLLPLKQRKIDEENDWVPFTKRICCPDPNGMVIYRIDTISNSPAPEPEEIRPRMLVDESKCTGCRACELTCSMANTGEFAPEKAHIQIEKQETEGLDRPQVCRQCGTAPCIEACPAKALTKDPATQSVLVDIERCTGCRLCQKACSFAAIHFPAAGRLAAICHLCHGDPQCVKRCPSGAITFGRKGGTR